jgi:hypothetical protein
VAVTGWSDKPFDPLTLFRGEAADRTPAQVLADADAAPPAPFDPEAYLDDELAETEAMFGVAPSPEEVQAALGPSPRLLAVDRWLLGWEEGRPRVDDGSGGQHLGWFDPHEGDRTYLLLLEAARMSEEAMAHLGFWGLETSGGLTPARLAGLVRGWRERFGAELVANWGTMLQFVVARPPQDLEAAYALAVEHWEVASDTMVLPGVPIRDHARALIGRDTWFLHNRP